jgi:AAA family ATP:ADP antiporter
LPPAFAAFIRLFVSAEPRELRALALAFACNFTLLGGYYILRPVRDTMATVLGVGQLPNLYTGTLVITLVCAPLFGWVTTRFRLSRVVPGLFWFWVLNILAFAALFEADPSSRWVATGYFWWFSVVNLFMVSIFWSLMADLFTPLQATRLFAAISAGGSLGAIAGPLVTRVLAGAVGVEGLLLAAAGSLVIVIGLVHLLMREKARLQAGHAETQASTLDHGLSGNPFDGFSSLFRSGYVLNQALFIMLMTWVATVAYFLQTDLLTRAFDDVGDRTRAIADIDLVVNIWSALVLIFGLGRVVTRFGVTAGLILNPLIMVVSFVAVALSPTVLVLQAVQVVRRVAQYAIARPSREICFTVMSQESRYKTKNVIDTVVYRFGDVSAAWMQAALAAFGLGLAGTVGLGLLSSGLWGGVAVALGRRYERLRAAQAAGPSAA